MYSTLSMANYPLPTHNRFNECDRNGTNCLKVNFMKNSTIKVELTQQKHTLTNFLKYFYESTLKLLSCWIPKTTKLSIGI